MARNVGKISSSAAKSGAKTAASGAASLLSSVKDMYDSHLEYKKVAQEEKTKRTQSDNITKAHIEEIRAKRDVLIKALENDHKLSKMKIDQSFSVIDKALENIDLKMLELGLGSMVRVAESGALTGLAGLISQLEDKDTPIDL